MKKHCQLLLVRHQKWPLWLLNGAWGLLLLLVAHAFDPPKLLQGTRVSNPQALQRVNLLVDEMQLFAKAKDTEKLRSINNFFNRMIQFEDDQYTWGKPDYWTSPIELLNQGIGDCEDYALAKYFTLIYMGVKPSKLRLVYVRADVGGTILAHMVLAYYPTIKSEPIILDNINGELLPASQRPDLASVFSFNAQGLWQGVSMSNGGVPISRLSKWRDVLARAKSEGWW